MAPRKFLKVDIQNSAFWGILAKQKRSTAERKMIASSLNKFLVTVVRFVKMWHNNNDSCQLHYESRGGLGAFGPQKIFASLH